MDPGAGIHFYYHVLTPEKKQTVIYFEPHRIIGT